MYFGGRAEDCWGFISAVFPLEATRGCWQCSQNAGQALGAALPSSGVWFTGTRRRQSGGQVVRWRTFGHTELWFLDTQTERERKSWASWTIMKGWFWQSFKMTICQLWWNYNIFSMKVQCSWPFMNLIKTVCIFNSTLILLIFSYRVYIGYITVYRLRIVPTAAAVNIR